MSEIRREGNIPGNYAVTISILIAIIALTSGCTLLPESTRDSSQSDLLTEEIPGQYVTATASCVSSESNINNVAHVLHIDDYRWSDDGQYVFFQSGTDWWEFSVADQTVTPLPDINVLYTPTPAAIEQQFLSIIEQEQYSAHYRSSTSPSEARLVYWINPQWVDYSTPTPSQEDQDGELVSEDFSYLAQSINEIYLLEDRQVEPVFIGEIPGGIKRIDWFPDEEKALLVMLPHSPNYLWVLNISTKSLIPLLSEEETYSSLNFDVHGISPDGQWILFRYSQADNMFLLYVDDASIKALYGFPSTPFAWWSPDGRRIVSVLGSEPGSYSVNIYDIQSEIMTQVSPKMKIRGWVDLISYSTNTVVLAILRHNSSFDELSILKLCVDM